MFDTMLATERKHALLAVPETVHFPPSFTYCKISLLYIYTYIAGTLPFAMNTSNVSQILNKSSYQISSPGVLSQRH